MKRFYDDQCLWSASVIVRSFAARPLRLQVQRHTMQPSWIVAYLFATPRFTVTRLSFSFTRSTRAYSPASMPYTLLPFV